MSKYLRRAVVFSGLMTLLAMSAPRAETVVLEAAAMLDVESGRIVKPAVIVVEDDKIVGVNARFDLADHGDAGPIRQQRSQTGARQRIVCDEQDPNSSHLS